MNIIIVSYTGSPWLEQCLNSIKNVRYPIYVVVNTPNRPMFESSGLQLGYSLKDNFVLLQDSVEVKDISLFDVMNNTPGFVSIGPDFNMCMGKYCPSLDSGYPPTVTTKEQSIFNLESGWCRQLSSRLPVTVLCPDFKDTNIFEERFGKTRMVLDCSYIKKWKNCWSPSMISNSDTFK